MTIFQPNKSLTNEQYSKKLAMTDFDWIKWMARCRIEFAPQLNPTKDVISIQMMPYHDLGLVTVEVKIPKDITFARFATEYLLPALHDIYDNPDVLKEFETK